MGVDLGVDRQFIPTVYTIRNRDSCSQVLMNWEFQASNDKTNWEVLDSRTYMTGDNDIDSQFVDIQKELIQKGQTSTW